ncbi:hypothetical protein [Natrialba sp. PRR66]|uniref:hypothetical protein n=1 Tax=Natrialba sp. PRR66 TaxID=3098146 RepID=UPI002B1D7541|nr:hypothetical protein [Natrialba sp. PRR66]
MSAIHIADTGLFAAMGQPSNRRYRVVRAFARRNDITFVLPERVYDELTVNDSDVENPPIDTAIDEGWARVADPLQYTNALVSRTMDGVQQYIANADDRPADEIERADPALAGVAAQAFVEGRADQAYIYTTDILAGEGAESVFASEGYGDSVTYVNGFRFIEDLLK